MTTHTIQKVLLAVPPTGLYIREERCQTPIEHMTTITLRPPIGLMYAAAGFEAGGATCKIIDYPGEGLDRARFEADLREFQPDLLILSVTTPGIEEDMRYTTIAKQVAPDTVIAAKGAHFNVLDLDALKRYPDLDLVFRGEYEMTCREMAEGRRWEDVAGITFRDGAGDTVRTPDRPFIEDLDAVPFPSRHLINNALYVRPDTGELQTTLVTNRGCPYECVFCLANQVAGRRNRLRSADNILAEIKECVEKYGIRSFLFRSDLFTANRKWLLELCEGIRSRGLDIDWSCNSRVDTLDEDMLAEMKKAGCWIIAFGIESGSQEMLDRMNKKTNLDKAYHAIDITRRAGILSSVYFLIGLPWETRETLEANERFARRLNPDILEIFYVYPFPGTSLYKQSVQLGLLAEGEIPTSAYDGPAMPSLELSREELVQARSRALKKFYLRPRVVLRTLARARSWKELRNYTRSGLSLLKEFI